MAHDEALALQFREGVTGFPEETLAFLRDLAANNTREWFTDHKGAYERALKAPAEAFAAAMAGRLRDMTGETHRAKIFRIHRDVRFSHDKTPYNAHLHISFTPAEVTGEGPAWLFGVEPGELALGVGIFAFEPEALDRYRRRVLGTDGGVLLDLMAELRGAGVRFSEPELKRVPSGYAADADRGELLRYKGLAGWIDSAAPETISDAGLVERCAAAFATLRPLFDWLRER